MILVAFAMPEEATDFVAWLQPRDLPVEVAYFGVGAAAVRENLPHLLEKWRPDHLICAGFAGALTQELALGEVFRARNPQGECPLPCRLKTAELFSANHVVNSAAERLEYALHAEAQAVDMETATVAEIAAEFRIPLLTIRVIIDGPNAPIPLPWTVSYDLEKQSVRRGAVIRWLLLHPGKWPAFFRFVRRLGHARRDLAAALATVLAEALP